MSAGCAAVRSPCDPWVLRGISRPQANARTRVEALLSWSCTGAGAWPVADTDGRTKGADEFEMVREAVTALRQIRAEYAVPPGANIEATAVGGDGVFKEESGLVERLTKSALKVSTSAPTGAAAHAVLTGGVSLVVPLAGLVDVDKEWAANGVRTLG